MNIYIKDTSIFTSKRIKNMNINQIDVYGRERDKSKEERRRIDMTV